LKPISNSNNQLENVFFTGRNLSNWNPSLELSGEGVSIASGWYSANNISSYLHD
jgi:anaerobic glycerol-3-phosphate dehydrogenase